jgi:hypothetical protein
MIEHFGVSLRKVGEIGFGVTRLTPVPGEANRGWDDGIPTAASFWRERSHAPRAGLLDIVPPVDTIDLAA